MLWVGGAVLLPGPVPPGGQDVAQGKGSAVMEVSRLQKVKHISSVQGCFLFLTHGYAV